MCKPLQMCLSVGQQNKIAGYEQKNDCYLCGRLCRRGRYFLWTNQEPQPLEPEYTEKEHVWEAEWARRETEAVGHSGLRGESELVMDRWCRCGDWQPMQTENECLCCTELDLVLLVTWCNQRWACSASLFFVTARSVERMLSICLS